MPVRKGHGGKNRHPIQVEVLPADELPRVDQEDIDARLAARKATGRPFQKGNKAGGRKPKLAKIGVVADDPKWKYTLRVAETYRRKRVNEFSITFGYVSLGVRGLLATAALQLACSRHMMEKAIQEGDMDLIRKASALANESRMNELAAWELCSREGGAKAKAAVNLAPWLSGGEPQVKDAVTEAVGVRVRVSETSHDPLAAAEPSGDNSEGQRETDQNLEDYDDQADSDQGERQQESTGQGIP